MFSFLLKLKLVNLPLLYVKLSFRIACKQHWCVLAANIFSIIIVTDWKLAVWFLFVWVIDNTNVATPECWPSLWIACDGKLSQIQSEFLSHINWKYKTSQWFVSYPMLFIWSPSHWSIASKFLPKLIMNQCQCICNVITQFMKFFYWKVMLWSSKNKFCRFYYSTLKMGLNNGQIFEDFAFKLIIVVRQILTRSCYLSKIFWWILLILRVTA